VTNAGHSSNPIAPTVFSVAHIIDKRAAKCLNAYVVAQHPDKEALSSREGA
jgi:hypothetical protein